MGGLRLLSSAYNRLGFVLSTILRSVARLMICVCVCFVTSPAEEPDPLLYPTKRRRRTMSEDDLRRSTDDPNPLSGSGSARRNKRAHTLDGDNSDDGSVFDTVSLKSNTSGKSSGRTRSCKDDLSLKSRTSVKGKETRAATGLKPGASSVRKSSKRGVGGNKSGSDEDASEDEDPSSDDGSDSSSSEDEKKEKKAGGSRSKASKDETDKKSKRGKKMKKKKERRAGESRLF